MDGEYNICCTVVGVFFLGLVAISLTLYASICPDPTFSLQQFYISGLENPLNLPKNASLVFTLELQNADDEKGLYYDPIALNFFDSPNREHSLGNLTIQKFYQGIGKSALRFGKVEIPELDRKAISEAITVNGSKILRVDLVTAVRHKIFGAKGKRHNIKVGANVQVDYQRTIPNVEMGDIQLKSRAVKIGIHKQHLGTLFLINFLFLACLS